MCFINNNILLMDVENVCDINILCDKHRHVSTLSNKSCILHVRSKKRIICSLFIQVLTCINLMMKLENCNNYALCLRKYFTLLTLFRKIEITWIYREKRLRIADKEYRY